MLFGPPHVCVDLTECEANNDTFIDGKRGHPLNLFGSHACYGTPLFNLLTIVCTDPPMTVPTSPAVWVQLLCLWKLH